MGNELFSQQKNGFKEYDNTNPSDIKDGDAWVTKVGSAGLQTSVMPLGLVLDRDVQYFLRFKTITNGIKETELV